MGLSEVHPVLLRVLVNIPVKPFSVTFKHLRCQCELHYD